VWLERVRRAIGRLVPGISCVRLFPGLCSPPHAARESEPSVDRRRRKRGDLAFLSPCLRRH
jgi:hypothetical protein